MGIGGSLGGGPVLGYSGGAQCHHKPSYRTETGIV